ncbi:hypothetical protein ZOSMA_372G00070 [Zostera marina]|uniref:FAS1 domain-containing protein n=1 Tax=Zostera marina TaxID=29655 RepID=A0A0K9P5T3_ZOSMR|nr:hypothetical protein ZOSMA_372G00070 [Zostera marina]
MIATQLAVMLAICFILSSSSAVFGASQNPWIEDVDIAIKEMKGANYFTFVTLMNMVEGKLGGNATLLMPNDQLLSNIPISEDRVMEFLSKHLIPSRLLLDDLARLPNGTMLPTGDRQGYLLTITSNVHTSFMLNNVKIVGPNICVQSSIICHGIDGILSGAEDDDLVYVDGCHQVSAGFTKKTLGTVTLFLLFFCFLA